ncbi:HD-GYP domain-containing protein [Acidovorax sp. HDW3]|uniref:HD-GYP domain-containing protein n=1 Tax=Acidovorax sp. HDW3 TaxID=2714923 RepID=UPI0014076D7D|nr:HD-GYP domain-containing protein [Acidovorax sp. HDW3]QIL44874.1 HD-GYP domain-containing protein [Acidovorax sp. HDW3]
MLKRIHVQHLTLGMYLHEFCGSWMEHPFWRTRFLLEDAHDLELIHASEIHEVWIDVSKGLDVAAGTHSVSRAEADAQAEADLQQAAAHSASAHPAPNIRRQPSPMVQELRRAAQICAASKKAVVSMFHEARMGRAVDPAQAQELIEDMSDSIARNPGALVSLARLKTADDYTYMHSVAVAALMISLARNLGMNEEAVHIAGTAGLMHDLGKAKMPMEVLNKPGKLTDEEFAIMRAHPVHSHAMLKDSGLHPQALDACLHHHEKMDGTGYPDRLQGEQISVLARMTAICDVYDAITSNRPYKNGWDPSESLRRMAEWSKDHFDARLFQAFVKTMGIYPVGSLVRLGSGRLAVVTEQSPDALLAPRVRVFYSTKSQLRIPPELLDLSRPGCTEKIVAREDPAQWNFPDLNDLWSSAGA